MTTPHRIRVASTATLLCLALVPAARSSADVPPDYTTRQLAPIAPASTPRDRPPVPDGALSDRVVSYAIKARLDPADGAKSVMGSEHLTWRNTSSVPVQELQFHLYLNAFRDQDSTFMRESGGQLRGDQFAGKYGSIEITSMKTAAGEDLLPSLEFIHPDDDNANDRTVARVPLPAAVAPGQTIALDIDFLDKLPQVFARTGYKDNFFLIAQWFPKIGVLEPAGMRGRTEAGWNCHQFHADSEFYADFGTFDVEITAPAKFVVGATGERTGEAPGADGTTTWVYHQDDVHDFAWTADDNYVEGTRTFTEPGFQTVAIRALVQEEHKATLERHLDAAEKSLRWFDREIGPYPYKTLTVVDSQDGADGAGGMEYPTFITAGMLPLSGPDGPPDEDPTLEVVIFHEFGHQYWYGMVASNEFEEPWMDEGVNSYTESRGMNEIWPDKNWLAVRVAGVPVELPIPFPGTGRTVRFASLPQFVSHGPLINKAWGFKGEYSYGINTYYRTAAVMRTLEGYLGKETMSRVMRTYFERWRFRHPTSQDFFDVASEVSGQDLTWFFDEFFRDTRALDYAVQRVKPKANDAAHTEIILERNGDAVLPVHARVTRVDGSTEEIAWDGRDPQFVTVVDSASPVTRVEIDPDRVNLLDYDMANNSWLASGDAVGPLRLASDWALMFEHALVTAAGAL